MPNDYITIKALTSELSDILTGGRINKIYMPEKDEISLSLRAGGENRLLVISTSPQNPRIHLSNEHKENPLTAPGFCMYLRKYFTGGQIKKISLCGEDRIIRIDVETHNEMRDTLQVSLVAEMMGRYSNLIALDHKGNIGAAIKQVPFDTATKRCILPGTAYSAPVQTKILPSDSGAAMLALKNYNGGGLSTYIAKNFAGYAQSTAAFTVKLSGIDNNSERLDEKDAQAVMQAMNAMLGIYGSPLYKPCCLIKNGTVQDYFVCPYDDKDEYMFLPTLNQCIGKLTTAKDIEERHKEHTRDLTRRHKSLMSKTDKKLEKCRERLKECEGRDLMKKYGDLITVNMYAVKRGESLLHACDVYDTDGGYVDIPLDPTLSPQQNAQAYYKKYAKLKRTFQAATEQIQEAENLKDYLRGIEKSIEICSAPAELAEIESELAMAGAVRQRSIRDKRIKPASPIVYEIGGYRVTVGKNNIQNDKLTFKTAEGGDIWLHAKDAHGSHVIISCKNALPPDSVLAAAAQIAAYYSQSSQADKTVVDYTRRKFVKRHPMGKPGMVIYTDYKSLTVTPDRHESLIVSD